jgi:hypothetical protein
MADMTVHPLPAPVQVFVIAVCCFVLAWSRWRQGDHKKYWITVAWWMAIGWAVWTVLFAAYSFLNR